MAESSTKQSGKPKKKKPWIRVRHRVWRDLAYLALMPYTKLRYRLDLQKFKDQGKRQYLILMNHQTPFDQFFVGMAFRGPVYYVATEDLFSNGWISRFLRHAVAPIPIRKAQNDVRAVLDCMRVAREGGTIAIAPEGNRTYSGKLCEIKPTIVQLAKKLKLPIAIFRIEGGYGAEPRWSNVVRRGGGVKAYVSEVLEPEDYCSKSDEELFETIRRLLDVNEAKVDRPYSHKKSAEYLERMLYVCPDCGLSSFASSGKTVRCLRCGKQWEYLPSKEFSPAQPYRFAADWYDAQEQFIRQLELDDYIEQPAYTESADLYRVIPYDRKVRIKKQVQIRLYGDRVELDEMVLPFEKLRSVSISGRNKLNLVTAEESYQIKGSKRFNALKYMHFYYHAGRETYGEFLGI